MREPLKLSAIEQEHLQEVYDAAKTARDELPYTPIFDTLCDEFQGRTFKNAHPEQVFGAILKYVRSSSNAAGVPPEVSLSDEQLKQIKGLIPRFGKAGKLLPYSDEIEALRKEFSTLSGTSLEEREFWQAMVKAAGPKRVPPPRKAKAKAASDEDDE